MHMLTSPTKTMTSQEIADLLEKRHDKVKQSIERLADRSIIQHPPLGEVKNHLGQTVEVYQVNERDSYVVVAQLSPEFTARLVDYWQAHKNQPAQIPTTAEAFAQAFRLLADAEARDAQRDQRMNLMDARIEHVERIASLTAKPQHCETKSEAKARMNKQYGLPAWVSDLVLTTSPYRPPVFGMVKNSNENAQGSSFAVYQIIEVTKLFKRFVSECKPATPTTATHPDIDRRFKLTRRE